MARGTCSLDDCEKAEHAQGLCNTHYTYRRKAGQLERVEWPMSCKVDGCDRKHCAKGYCSVHWARNKRGTPLDAPIRMIGVEKRLDEFGRKECSACRQILSASEFHPRKGVSDGLFAKCRPCLLRYNRAKKYGITPERIDEMYDEQDGRCAVCRTPIGADCHIDHDHECCAGYRSCGECVRGLLCNSCNLMLGMAKDSIPTLLAAAEYLQKGNP